MAVDNIAGREGLRRASYRELGLIPPKDGTGIISPGLRVSEQLVVEGGLDQYPGISGAKKVREVEVKAIGVHVQAQGEVAKIISGDETAEVVILDKNVRTGKDTLKVARRTAEGGRKLQVIDLAEVGEKHPLLDTVTANLRHLLRVDRKPFDSEPVHDFRAYRPAQIEPFKSVATPLVNGVSRNGHIPAGRSALVTL